ncbi:hypothetical protein BN1723_000802, partial [Verticillium longisporum]
MKGSCLYVCLASHSHTHRQFLVTSRPSSHHPCLDPICLANKSSRRKQDKPAAVMSSDNLKGLNTRTHPHVPSWFFIVQLVVLALGLGVFIASAYSLSFFDGYGYAGAYSGSPGFLLFAALLIFIVVGSHIVLERFFSQWYFR